jgi:hypothetical protein
MQNEAVRSFSRLGLRAIDFSPDGQRVVAAFSDHSLQIFRIKE